MNNFFCPICRESINDVNKEMLYCSHIFCKNCINIWKLNSNKCPLCRRNIIYMDKDININYCDKDIDMLKKVVTREQKEKCNKYVCDRISNLLKFMSEIKHFNNKELIEKKLIACTTIFTIILNYPIILNENQKFYLVFEIKLDELLQDLKKDKFKVADKSIYDNLMNTLLISKNNFLIKKK